ncbi:hypothetical protein [Clostridium perfringens]|uniref:hypothetical protein n=1 Tax=Clostridium perfringens TaxID=1502 RepID=UPI00109444B5|nr:hypothetical protein [Clostridium perfringens]TGY45083.1 hypothetical protein E5346_10230 [Clostridium perfringens]
MIKWLISLFKKGNKGEVKKEEVKEIFENDILVENDFESTLVKECIEKKSYEVINYIDDIPMQEVKWNSSYTYEFESNKIEGYKVLKKERIVGCFYRKENIDEIIETFKSFNSNKFKFNLVVERDYYNEYDSNAQKVSLIYNVGNETRKMHIGFLSRECALELKDYYNIKVNLIKIENIDYKDTYLEILLNSELVDEIKEKESILQEKRKKLEEERELRELNFNVAYEMNQLAMKLEEMGKIDEAIEKYEEAIKLGFDGSRPYDRLNVHYRKRKDYDSEIANCKQAIKIFGDLKVLGRCDAPDKLERYKLRLLRAQELKEKEIERERTKKEREKTKAEKLRAKQEKSEKLKLQSKSEEVIKTISLNKELSEKKFCTICRIEKSIDDFEKSGKDSKGNIKYKNQCKVCRNELRRNKNKEKELV